uniref:Uncharacterized protein n=1 Tax=Leersia perrieri TaxID=77586 RepID=A0A0D9UXM4_9ORYZ
MAATDLDINDGNDAVDVVIDMGQQLGVQASGGAGGDDAATAAKKKALRLPRYLGAVGVLTGAMAVAAAVHGSPPPAGTLLARGGGLAYYLGLGGSFAAGVGEVWAAMWVAGAGDDGDRRAAVGRKVLFAGVVPFLVVVAIGGVGVHLKN